MKLTVNLIKIVNWLIFVQNFKYSPLVSFLFFKSSLLLNKSYFTIYHFQLVDVFNLEVDAQHEENFAMELE